MCDEALYSLRVQDSGRLVACGSQLGGATLLEVSCGLSTIQRNEKSLLAAVRHTHTHTEAYISRTHKFNAQNVICNKFLGTDQQTASHHFCRC